jgi:protein tyrosine phosphatase
MIYAKNVKMIVMLCNIQEKGRTKCAKYWPSKKLSLSKLTIEQISEEKSTNLVIRKFNIKDNNITKEVTQLHFISWPDHGVPEIDEVYDDFTKMIEKVEQAETPVVIHCSAGIGRTGTFMSFYNIDNYFKNKNTNISIFNIVRKLKEQRLGSVENILQYKLIYSFLDKYLKKLV